MRVVSTLLAGAVVILGAGCRLLDVSGARSSRACPESAVINAGNGVTDFKQRVPRQTAVAPPDSILDVVLIFDSVIAQADRDRIVASGGTNVSSAGTAAALKAEFRAQDLNDYVAGDAGRLSDVVIYIPACATF
jgi:hypothetical protein